MDQNLDDFFTKKHWRLSRIATTSSVFSWLVLFFFSLLTISQFVSFFRFQGMFLLQNLSNANPLEVFNSLFEMLRFLIQGFVFFLVLRGISLGLNMIIETDLNYRDANQGVQDE